MAAEQRAYPRKESVSPDASAVVESHTNVSLARYTILTRREMMILRHRIAEIDPEAFINVIDSKEILGRGFKPLKES